MILGNSYLQFFFKLLFKFSLKGLNYGRGANFRTSGELFVLNFVKNKFKKNNEIVIFDVGGNIGNYSKELVNVFNENATIHAFEPSKFTFIEFTNTTKKFKNIKANNFGLSDSENNQTLYSNYDGSSLASIYKRKLDHFEIEMDKSEDIKLSTIDIYCESNNIYRINFLKLDIEGHELKALQGAEKMLSNKKIDIIQFEFGGCNIDSRTYFKDFYYLFKDNYKIYRILSNGLLELPKYKETYEIFTTVNYLAVLR